MSKNNELLMSAIHIAPYTVTSFLMLVLVSFGYTWYIGIYRWPPTSWDILIPFALGLAEILPLFYLGISYAWWWLTSVLCFIGACAFYHTLWYCRKCPDMFGKNVYAYNRVVRSLTWDIVIALACGFIFALGGYAQHIVDKKLILSWRPVEIAMIILVIYLGSIIIVKDQEFLEKLYKDYGLDMQKYG